MEKDGRKEWGQARCEPDMRRPGAVDWPSVATVTAESESDSQLPKRARNGGDRGAAQRTRDDTHQTACSSGPPLRPPRARARGCRHRGRRRRARSGAATCRTSRARRDRSLASAHGGLSAGRTRGAMDVQGDAEREERPVGLRLSSRSRKAGDAVASLLSASCHNRSLAPTRLPCPATPAQIIHHDAVHP